MDPKPSQIVSCVLSALRESSPDCLSALLRSEDLSRDDVSQAVLRAVETWSAGQSVEHLKMAMQCCDWSSLRNSAGLTVAALAAKAGLADVLEAALEVDSSVAARKDASQKTLLHLCLETEQNDPVAVVAVLLKANLSASAADCYDNTPLHFAARSGCSESLSALLTTRCNANAQNRDGDTPLHLAVRHKKNKCVEVLLQHGASSSQINFARKRPKDEAQGVTLAVFSKHERPATKPPNTRWGDAKATAWQVNEPRKPMLEPAPIVRASKPEYSAPTAIVRPKEPPTVAPPTPEDRRLPLEKQLENERRAKEAVQENVNALEQSLAKTNAELQVLKDKLTEQKAKSEVKFLFPRILGQQENVIPQLQQDLERFTDEVRAWQTQCQPMFQKAISRLKTEVQTQWANCDLEEYGSYANSLHLPKSDIDLVIVGPAPSSSLQDLLSVVRVMAEVTSCSHVATAFIPVLKIEMCVDGLDFRIDITQQDPRHTGVRCSALVKQKIESIPHLREVNLAVKHLFQVCEFSEPFRGGISSYAVFLMVLYFFQSHLPPMEERYSLAEPLLHFLNFYSYIVNYQDPICVREVNFDPSFFPLALEPYLIIVDPISPTRNVAHNTNLEVLLYILRLATKYLQREGACECQSQVFLNMLQETKSALNWS